MKIIFLNGPPRSGKDFAGRLICDMSIPLLASCDKFARRLKEMTHALYLGEPLHDAAYESVKDQPLPSFLGVSPRQAYIAVSERLMKPLHGQDVFGRMLLADISGCPDDVVCITDSGFAAEAEPLIRWAGAENCLLVRLHREGCSFQGDSRSYLELPGVTTVDVVNPGTVDGLRRVLDPVLEFARS